MTARMYAQRKGWDLSAVRVLLRHDKMHAADCEHCEARTGKLDRIDVQVWFEGELDDEQRHRLLEITEKCPVHKTLQSEVVIASRPGDDD
jgi:putative redox protein